MAEFGVAATLTTPAGTLTFNASSGNAYHLSDISGLDMAVLRTAQENLPQRDGATVFDSYLGSRNVTVAGQIVPAGGSFTTRRTMEDDLRAALLSILRADGTLKWRPSGASVDRMTTVRLGETLQIRGGILKDFTFNLVSGTGIIETDTLVTTDTGALSGGTVTTVVTNGGNAPAYPKLRVYGGIANPVVTNDTVGEEFWLAYTVAGGAYVEIDTRPGVETIKLNGSTSLADKLTITSLTKLWALAAGANTVRLTGTSPNGSEKLRVLHRDTWA